MRAAHFKRYGGAEVVEVTSNASMLTLEKGQVHVKVHAAAINPIDWKVRAGYLKEKMPLDLPVILGGDFAGVITELGEGVSEFSVGDAVYGQAGILNGGSGAIAEFAIANAKKIAHKPKVLDHQEAASLPLAGVSALQAIEEHIKLQPGQKILIHGGAGGIGSIAIQLAKEKGAYVATTASAGSADFVKQLGADEVIDYKSQDFTTILRNYDAVFDTVGGTITDKSFVVIKAGGIIVSMSGQPNHELADKYSVTAIRQGTESNAARLTRLAELVDNGKVKVQIDKIFPLEQSREAFTYQETGHPKGKVVIRLIE